MGNSKAAQNYKIYVNDSLLTLADDNADIGALTEYSDSLWLHYRGKTKLLLNIVDNLEKSKTKRQIILTSPDLKTMFEDAIQLFRWTEAGGGVVRHPSGEILAIFRRKRWDLPKGKLDPGETFKKAAVREVLEETGLQSVTAGKLVTTSMHAFRTRSNTRALKVTKWYAMETEHREVECQVEEDIEQAEWIDPQRFIGGVYDVYESIKDVVRQYLDNNAVP